MRYTGIISNLKTQLKAFATMFTEHRVVAVLSLSTAISLTGAVYFYARLASLQSDPQAIAQDETSKLIADVGRLILLPEGETPTVATVSDVEKLKDQPFFAHAKNGYKVLIYSNSRRAILYDPINNKIIDVAPLDTGAGPQ